MHGEAISNAKSRIFKLLDEGSFIEFDELQDAGVIIGYGTIFSRPVCVISQALSLNSFLISETNRSADFASWSIFDRIKLPQLL